MSVYLLLKTLHILSATVLFGTGLGIAYFKWSTDRTQDPAAIRAVSDRVVTADWLFTLPTAILQPVTGLALALYVGYPLTSRWLMLGMALYAAAGACWIRVIWLQIRMRDLAQVAAAEEQPLGADYAHLNTQWFYLGVAAFTMFIVIFWLMVARPV